jgi:hypothetical protein
MVVLAKCSTSSSNTLDLDLNLPKIKSLQNWFTQMWGNYYEVHQTPLNMIQGSF